MSDLAKLGSTLPAASPEDITQICEIESRVGECEQLRIQTEHIIHGGMYARTVRLAPGNLIVGALIKVPTVIIVNGDTAMLAGQQWHRMSGYNIMPANPGRKQIFYAFAATEITMIFATKAKSVEEAESRFTDEVDNLMSRRAGDDDLVNITGVEACQE